jgi:glycerol kinase
VLQMPLDVYPSPHATALGAAALGRLALSPHLSLEQAVPAWTPADSFEPQWTPEQSSDFLGRWRLAVAAALPGTTHR